MFTIYDLKKQIHNLILKETQDAFINGKEKNIYTIVNANNSYNNTDLTKDKISIHLAIKSINLESIDTKTSYYKINFILFFNFNNRVFYNNEQIIYNVLEKILQLLNSMEFYYCYKVINNNIKSNLPFNEPEELNSLFITVEWVTNLNINTSWFS